MLRIAITVVALFLLTPACIADPDDGSDEIADADTSEQPSGPYPDEARCCDCDNPWGIRCWNAPEDECEYEWCEEKNGCIAQCKMRPEPLTGCCTCDEELGPRCEYWLQSSTCNLFGVSSRFLTDCEWDEILDELVCVGVCDE